jgi:hypothetical protein
VDAYTPDTNLIQQFFLLQRLNNSRETFIILPQEEFEDIEGLIRIRK